MVIVQVKRYFFTFFSFSPANNFQHHFFVRMEKLRSISSYYII